MQNDAKPVILFDVLDTLVTDPVFTAVPEFFGMSARELFPLLHATSWIEFEKGRISEAEYLKSFFRDGRTVDGARLRKCLKQAYRWVDGMEQLAADLKSAGHELYALSNYSLWYELIDESVHLSRFLRWTFVSCLTGVRKPDPQAFLGAAETLKVEPADCLFIDDHAKNVEAARGVGMDAILKLDAAQVRAEMVQRRVRGA